MPNCGNFDVKTIIFYIGAELEYIEISETRFNFIADMVYASASNKVYPKDAKSWTLFLKKYHEKKIRATMTTYEKNKYTKKSFADKLISMKSTT